VKGCDAKQHIDEPDDCLGSGSRSSSRLQLGIVYWILCVEKGTIINFGLHLPQQIIERGFFNSKAVCLTNNRLTCAAFGLLGLCATLQAPDATGALTSDDYGDVM
jgi:hypothetical protein